MTLNNSSIEFASGDLSNLTKGTAFRGFVEILNGGVISGWCIAADDPTATVNLGVYIKDILVGSTETRGPRSDITSILGVPINAGFSFDLRSVDPDHLGLILDDGNDSKENGSGGLISIMIESSGLRLPLAPSFNENLDLLKKLLRGSAEIPTDLKNLSASPAYRGRLDSYEDGVFRGWCLDASNPSDPLTMSISIAGFPVGEMITVLHRPDISQALEYPVKAGFQFSIKNASTTFIPQIIEGIDLAFRNKDLLNDLICVKIKDKKLCLSNAPGIRQGEIDLSGLKSILLNKLYEHDRNNFISKRNNMLSNTPKLSFENDSEVSVIAFYLPQYHPFDENDEWWGEGFTEWTNVTSSSPVFENHFQPRLPADLGYYDLRIDEIHEKQVRLAKAYGVTAFCYYYYWFSGKTLMTMPINRHLEKKYGIDFCLCWANENWSRRWDGSEEDVLLTQQHSPISDVGFIEAVMPYFSDPRYIKIDGAPLLIVYRISLMSDPARTLAAWREKVKEAGFPDIHVCMAETFGLTDPNSYAADSSCQFPPHGILAKDQTSKIEGLIPGFTGKIYDYAEVVVNEIKRIPANHLQFRCAMPSWDNTSRKGLAGHVFHDASPDLFEVWLSYLVAQARQSLPRGKRLVFINAWNEWAEGAYLEPDRRYGHANLRAVRNALSLRNDLLAAMLEKNEAEPSYRNAVSGMIDVLTNANAELVRLLTNYGQKHSPPSCFIVRPEQLLQRITRRRDGRFQIEALNGRSASVPMVTIHRENGLDIRGWVRIPATQLSSNLPIFIWLTGLDQAGSDVEFIASIYDRELRHDVASAFNDPLDDAWNGINFKGDLRGVAPGAYQLGLLIGSAMDPAAAVAVLSEIRLLIS